MTSISTGASASTSPARHLPHHQPRSDQQHQTESGSSPSHAPGEGIRRSPAVRRRPARTSFDVSRYTREVGGRIDVPGEMIAASVHPDRFPGAEREALLRDLRHLQHVESAALVEVRTMYSSWTVNDARITAFIASWLWERMWWARALEQLVDALVSPDPAAVPPGSSGTVPSAGPDTPAPGAPPTLSRLWSSRRAPLSLRGLYVRTVLPMVGAAVSGLIGERVTAGHMARMAMQEGALQAAYGALLPRAAQRPEVHRILLEIRARRARALPFFHDEAVARITGSRGEALAARSVLAVGGDVLRPAGVRAASEDPALASIFRTSQDRAALRLSAFEITRLLPAAGRSGLRATWRAIRRAPAPDPFHEPRGGGHGLRS